MVDCVFLSNEEEKIVCFKECPFYRNEDSIDSCPFKNLLLLKNVRIMDYQFDYLYDEEEAVVFLPRIYKERYD